MDLTRARASLRLRALDARDRASGRADRLVPPRRMDFVGHSDFVGTGDEFSRYLVEHAGVKADSHVLDAGCGIGRMARPLTEILGPDGAYEGFDVNREGIGWCRRHYHRHPNFRFVLADLHNARYHPAGAFRAAEYRFPYDDERFDVVLMASVLTHLLAEECDHYLAEAARVLKPGGRLLATFFALNDTSRALMTSGAAGLVFGGADEQVAVLDETMPEEAVAYADEWIFERLREHGLELTALHPGSWCGREEFLSFQDVLVAVRSA